MFVLLAGDEVFDIVVRKWNAKGACQVDLVSITRSINLGFIMKDTSGVTDNWWAFGYFPNSTFCINKLPDTAYTRYTRLETARGFATRRLAIEHMLRRCGWWSD